MSRAGFLLPWLVAASLSATTEITSEPVYHLVRATDRTTLETLIDNGADTESVIRRAGHRFDVVARADIVDAVLEGGGALEILQTDLASWYAHRLRSTASTSGRLQTDPEHFVLGSMGGYLTYTEVVDDLERMHQLFPHLASEPFAIGSSVYGRPLWAIKLSAAPELDEDEPEVLYNSLIHAREPAAMMVLHYFMWWLLDGYGTEAEATAILDSRELFFVPVVNPDGYERNRFSHPAGGGMWRHNLGSNGGVDLNRNWSYNWAWDNLGSSGTPGLETYRGPAPFSEPESTALRDFMTQRNILSALHYHTFGNVLVHPFGYDHNTYAPEPDRTRFSSVLAAMAEHNGFAVGSSTETVGYLVNGSAVDWSYGEQTSKPVIYGITSEVGGSDDGFWPATERILPLARANLQANIVWARAAGVHGMLATVAEVHDQAGSDDGIADPGERVQLSIAVTAVGFAPEPLPPATLRLECDSPWITVTDATATATALTTGTPATSDPDLLEVDVHPATPAGSSIPMTVEVTAAGVGAWTAELELAVLGDITVAIFEPSDVSEPSGSTIQSALAQLSIPSILISDVARPFPTLDRFDTLFVLYGMSPGSHLVRAGSAEAAALTGVLDRGGSVWLEGGDLWAHDPAEGGHDFGPRLGVRSSDDGVAVIDPLTGYNAFAGLACHYTGANSSVDRLLPLGDASGALLESSSSQWTVVARNDGYTGARTFASSLQLAGLIETQPADRLVLRIIDHLGMVGPPTSSRSGDLTFDGVTDAADLAILISASAPGGDWSTGERIAGDMNWSGALEAADLPLAAQLIHNT